MLFSVVIIAFEARPIRPFFYSEAMLNILKPLACVGGAIFVQVYSLSVCLIVEPLALIDITISMDKSPATVGLVIRPISFIKGIVLPYLFSHTMSNTVDELPYITSSPLESNRSLNRF
jgi:hypothetical protein